jgi:hypothetical protein
MIYQYYVKSTTGLKFVTIWDEAKLVVVGQTGTGYALGYDFQIEVKRLKDLVEIANKLVKGFGYTILDNYMDRDEIERIKKQVRGY